MAGVMAWEIVDAASFPLTLQYVCGQDVDRFLKLGNFASTTYKHGRRDRENEFCMPAFSCKSNIGRDIES